MFDWLKRKTRKKGLREAALGSADGYDPALDILHAEDSFGAPPESSGDDSSACDTTDSSTVDSCDSGGFDGGGDSGGGGD
jgi:hypothetical protein